MSTSLRLEVGVNESIDQFLAAFGALSLLVGRQKEHLVCKILSVEILAQLSVWSEVQIICM